MLNIRYCSRLRHWTLYLAFIACHPGLCGRLLVGASKPSVVANLRLCSFRYQCAPTRNALHTSATLLAVKVYAGAYTFRVKVRASAVVKR
ncbi:hypothetical protein EXIGLDRAFT_498767 [Exidia glandulosa HHB12029]|uniref:Uncharacterized protein n=1 Tax=Exidia glandulosa HHB12029 TaxID=1314781 RepID=A0A165JFU7_EXIGL|nr:hypothetical protein EXIGLDRAFT_498767 [Exidia glandulosa HHB12029]